MTYTGDWGTGAISWSLPDNLGELEYMKPFWGGGGEGVSYVPAINFKYIHFA